MRLLLIRHGETIANSEHRLQGHLDYELSERGRRESERIAQRLAGVRIDALYSSPLGRAHTTAEALSGALDLPIEEEPGLLERDVGELSGLTRDEIRARYPEYVKARLAGTPITMVKGFESDQDMAERVKRTMESISERHRGQTVAAVSHGGVITMYCRQTLGLPVVRPVPFSISNASLTEIDVTEDEFDPRIRARAQLIFMNDTAHLEGL